MCCSGVVFNETFSVLARSRFLNSMLFWDVILQNVLFLECMCWADLCIDEKHVFVDPDVGVLMTFVSLIWYSIMSYPLCAALILNKKQTCVLVRPMFSKSKCCLSRYRRCLHSTFKQET